MQYNNCFRSSSDGGGGGSNSYHHNRQDGYINYDKLHYNNFKS